MSGERFGFIITLILYGIAMLSYLSFFVTRKLRFSDFGRWMVRAGLAFHTYTLVTRTMQTSYLPLTNQYEFAASFAWGISLCFISFEWRYRFKMLGTFATPIILAVTFYAALQSSEIKPLMPALQSRWLFVHVSTAILSYGSFAIACSVSAMYIIRDYIKEDDFTAKYMPSYKSLDMISYRATAIGFLMLTFVIVTGAIWAERAWGRYWQWDPKETWSFITWVIYAIYLHVRLNRGWKNKKAAWYSVIGFISILFTYIGVNTILSGYHSYGIAPVLWHILT